MVRSIENDEKHHLFAGVLSVCMKRSLLENIFTRQEENIIRIFAPKKSVVVDVLLNFSIIMTKHILSPNDTSEKLFQSLHKLSPLCILTMIMTMFDVILASGFYMTLNCSDDIPDINSFIKENIEEIITDKYEPNIMKLVEVSQLNEHNCGEETSWSYLKNKINEGDDILGIWLRTFGLGHE